MSKQEYKNITLKNCLKKIIPSNFIELPDGIKDRVLLNVNGILHKWLYVNIVKKAQEKYGHTSFIGLESFLGKFKIIEERVFSDELNVCLINDDGIILLENLDNIDVIFYVIINLFKLNKMNISRDGLHK